MRQVGYEDADLEAVVDGGDGVYRMGSVHREIGEPAVAHDAADAADRLAAMDNVRSTDVDPGQKLATSAVTAMGQLCRRSNVAAFIEDPPSQGHRTFEISGEDFRTWNLATRDEEGEAQRRVDHPRMGRRCRRWRKSTSGPATYR